MIPISKKIVPPAELGRGRRGRDVPTWAGAFSFSFLKRKAQAGTMSKLRKQLDRFLLKKPKLGEGVYIARGAAVLGDVTIGDYSSVWCNAVLRGDINRIVVGH